MELAYTLFFFIFIFNWFSRYNFITFVLFMTSCNIIRNVRVYMVKNNIENTSNPFLLAIKWSGDTIGWFGKMLGSSSSGLSDRFGLIKWLGLKYKELNTHFLELLSISKKQTTEQFASIFNYSLNAVIMPPPLQTISTKSIKTTEKEMNQLNREYEKKNSIYLPLFSTMIGTSSSSIKQQALESIKQTLKAQEEITKINTIIKDLDSNILNKKKIVLYDSDDDKEKLE